MLRKKQPAKFAQQLFTASDKEVWKHIRYRVCRALLIFRFISRSYVYNLFLFLVKLPFVGISENDDKIAEMKQFTVRSLFQIHTRQTTFVDMFFIKFCVNKNL